VGTNTIQLHRVFRTSPGQVYKAFLDPEAMVKWLPPNGFTGQVQHMNVKMGGTFKMSFTNFTTGKSHSFGGEYLELIPNKLIRYTDRFDDVNLPGEMQVTVTLKPVSVGTEVHITQAGIPDVIPMEACYLGWQESLTLLAQLIEAEIPED
jgi:uncharacterized protein YndB with AHSA1/START domain